MYIKLHKIGNSLGATFPKEVLEQLNLQEGDALTLVILEDGFKLTFDRERRSLASPGFQSRGTSDPEFDRMIAAYQQGASQYRNAMKELADG